MEQKEYWNKVSETKQFSTPFQIEEFSKYVEKSDIILDVGCGYGRTLNELYTNGYKNLISEIHRVLKKRWSYIYK